MGDARANRIPIDFHLLNINSNKKLNQTERAKKTPERSDKNGKKVFCFAHFLVGFFTFGVENFNINIFGNGW